MTEISHFKYSKIGISSIPITFAFPLAFFKNEINESSAEDGIFTAALKYAIGTTFLIRQSHAPCVCQFHRFISHSIPCEHQFSGLF